LFEEGLFVAAVMDENRIHDALKPIFYSRKN